MNIAFPGWPLLLCTLTGSLVTVHKLLASLLHESSFIRSMLCTKYIYKTWHMTSNVPIQIHITSKIWWQVMKLPSRALWQIDSTG